MECFVLIVIGFQPLSIITKHSNLDVAAAPDPPLTESSDTSVFKVLLLYFDPYVNFPNLEDLKGLQNFH